MNGQALQRQEEIPREALWLLLRTQARKYTQGDHGSLPVEVMEDLLSSLLFTLRQAPAGEDFLERRLALGQEEVQRKVRHAQVLLARVRSSALPVANQSYQDTLRGLPGFFAQYDWRFFAHQIPVDIDYQLYLPQFGGEGVDGFTAYLSALLAENRFCGRFSLKDMETLWEASSPDWRGLHINLYEPVLAGALGLSLLGENPRRLLFTRENQEAIGQILRPLSPEALAAAVLAAADRLPEALGLADADTCAYLRLSASALVPRLLEARENGTLAYVFFAKKENRAEQPAHFVDGPRMPDAAMWRLTKALRDCRDMEEKLALLRSGVGSLRDLGDLLSGCFWGDEVETVFSLLSGPEVEALASFYPGEDAPEWVERLHARREMLP